MTDRGVTLLLMPDGPQLTRHADHDPELPCRPARGNGLCELAPAGAVLVPWREVLSREEPQ